MMQKDYEVIDNFLEKESFEDIKKLLMSNNFPWFFADSVTRLAPGQEQDYDFYFTHVFFWRTPNSPFFEKIMPLIDKINPQAILRIKGNLFTNFGKRIDHHNHCDYNFSHQGAIFYINQNNGPTVLHDGTEIYPKENRILFFDPSKPHRSSTCSDQNVRVNINFNYFKVD